MPVINIFRSKVRLQLTPSHKKNGHIIWQSVFITVNDCRAEVHESSTIDMMSKNAFKDFYRVFIWSLQGIYRPL